MSLQLDSIIAGRLGISQIRITKTLELLDSGATVPFISRYRKEATGSLDEVQIGDIAELKEKLEEVEKRKQTIVKTIEEQGAMKPELKKQIEECIDLQELEDIYLPYKPKRRTKATMAKEKGLEPLAKILMKQNPKDLEEVASRFLSDNVANIEEATEGARHIIAEWVNEHMVARNIVRQGYEREAVLRSRLVKGKEEEGVKYRDYFDWQERLSRCPSHRLLAMRRGEKEGFLRLSISPDGSNIEERLDRFFVKGKNELSDQVSLAIRDSLKRLLSPSMETEFFGSSKEGADTEAIRVFADNLRQLLLAAPLGQKSTMALDPGYRTGCKLVCLDPQGNLVHNETIYPHSGGHKFKDALKKVENLVNAYKIDAIAIGNGTASRETEGFIKRAAFNRKVEVFVVSEDGASIYSASKVARDEFPQFDVTVRGSVSIGRRLMDPLAELVKLDPKSIGVGQYQHDVDQKQLQKSLDSVVESCVNLVGVNVNTASKHLLTYVSGLGPTLAQNIVDYRKENGAFASRVALKKVARMGDKAFEQCAGFLRIPDAKNPLDNSAVHPESYKLVQQMAKDLGVSVADIIEDEEMRERINLDCYVSDLVGLPTLTDIVDELAKPGLDPREQIEVFSFDESISKVEDLKEGMELPGIVSNITNFGAFVDVGVKQDGLVHVSNMADQFVSDPSLFVKLHQHVRVRVLEVDMKRKRIQLSMKDLDN